MFRSYEYPAGAVQTGMAAGGRVTEGTSKVEAAFPSQLARVLFEIGSLDQRTIVEEKHRHWG